MSSLRRLTWMVLPLVVIAFGRVVVHGGAEPQRGGNGQGVTHHADPCDHLPDPPGQAHGIERMCPGGGSSSGVARGDFNNDGFADLAIGEPGATIGGHGSAGDVIVIYGSSGGLTTTGKALWYEGRIPGTTAETDDRFGSALASGDFNDDGYSDLAIGVPGKPLHQTGAFGIVTTTQGVGAIVVIYGSSGGLTTTDSTVPAPRTFTLTQATMTDPPFGCAWDLTNASLGHSLAWGDFNQDGVADLIAGAPQLSWGAPLSLCTVGAMGGVWQLLGKAGATTGGLKTTGNRLWTQYDIPGSTNETADFFGWSLSGGDFNDDGYSDIAIGAPGESLETRTATTSFAGEVTVLFGGSLGANPGAGVQRWNLNSVAPSAARENDQFGTALASGDFNGDGSSDLAIGVPYGHTGTVTSESGFIIVMYGSSITGLITGGNQLFDASTFFEPKSSGDHFGAALVGGDFNADGKADLAIGAPDKKISVVRNGSQTSLTAAGEVDVIYGASTVGLSPTAHDTQVWTQENAVGAGAAHSYNHFGFSLTAWNFGHNEFLHISPIAVLEVRIPDLAIGVPGQDVAGLSDAGAVDVLYGSIGTGLVTTNRQAWTADNIGFGGLAGARFGSALY